jgi:hypothetical protein
MKGLVVETLTHSVIRKYGGSSCGKQSFQLKLSLWMDFPVDPCQSELTSDRGMHAHSDRRKQKRKAVNVVSRSHS